MRIGISLALMSDRREHPRQCDLRVTLSELTP
jgi:hypothetical protein